MTDAMIANAPPAMPKPTPEQRKQMEQMNADQNPKALAAVRLSYAGLKVDYDALNTTRCPHSLFMAATTIPAASTN